MSKLSWILSIASLIIAFQGCSSVNGTLGSSYKIKIEDDPFWEVVTVCGYEPCQPVAALKGKDGYIRIEPNTGTREESILTVELTFVELKDNQYEFDPSLIFIKFNGNKIVNTKGRRCNTTPAQIHQFKDALTKASGISGQQQLNKKFDCYISFFDIDNSLIGQAFSMKINGLIKDGQQINIPEIYFYRESKELQPLLGKRPR